MNYIKRIRKLKEKQAQTQKVALNTMETTEQQVGHYSVEVGITTQGSETIDRNLTWQAAVELAESKMNLMGGHWKQLYQVRNGQHLFRLDEHETELADNTPHIFIARLPFFGQEGTH